MRSILLSFLLGLCLCFVAAGEELPTRVPPGSAKIQLRGAWTRGFEAAWTGVGLRFRTDAARASLLMKDHAPGGPHPEEGNRNNYLAIRIDDGPAHVVSLEKGVERYAVPGLDGRPHTVTVFKRTEPLFGHVTFKGLELPENESLLDPPDRSDIRIQVIGDSISAGYGNEAAGPNDSFKPCQENGWMTYWAIAARRLGADVRCAAWSGRGVCRDRRGKTTGQLPQIWRLALPGKPRKPERPDVDWQPTMAIINLGTNDVARGIPAEEAFLEAYRSLIADIRSEARRPAIYCFFGPMIGEEKHGAIRGYLEKLAEGDDRIHVVTLRNEHGLEGVGSHWHPNVRSHESMARQLLEAIRATQWRAAPEESASEASLRHGVPAEPAPAKRPG